MASITSIEELKEYCLRRLGYPVLQINVSEDQIYDRISDALYWFNEFHYDATARILHKYQITQTDLDNQYIPVPDEIIFVKRVIPLQGESTSTADSILDPVYQMHVSDFLAFGYSGSSMQYWNQWGSHIKMLQMQLSGAQQEIDFNRHGHQLKIRVDWKTDMFLGQWVIIDAERYLLDPNGDISQTSDAFDNIFLKDYATALIKKQWASNLSKFSGVSMPGGVTFNGDTIMQEAKEEIASITENARLSFEEPLGLYTG